MLGRAKSQRPRVADCPRREVLGELQQGGTTGGGRERAREEMKRIKGQSCRRSITSAATLWHHPVFKEELTRAPDAEPGWKAKKGPAFPRRRGRRCPAAGLTVGVAHREIRVLRWVQDGSAQETQRRENVQNSICLEPEEGFTPLTPIIQLLSRWFSKSAVGWSGSSLVISRREKKSRRGSAHLCTALPAGNVWLNFAKWCSVIGVHWTSLRAHAHHTPASLTVVCDEQHTVSQTSAFG